MRKSAMLSRHRLALFGGKHDRLLRKPHFRPAGPIPASCVNYSARAACRTIVARSVTGQRGHKKLEQPRWSRPSPAAKQQYRHRRGRGAAAPTGYTWLVNGPAVLVNPSIYKDGPAWNAMGARFNA